MLVTGKMCIVCRTKMEKQAALDELSPYEEYEEFGLTEEEMLGYTPGDQ